VPPSAPESPAGIEVIRVRTVGEAIERAGLRPSAPVPVMEVA
jgi:hypothetical protein